MNPKKFEEQVPENLNGHTTCKEEDYINIPEINFWNDR